MVRADDLRLHSRYDPSAEASRYLRLLVGDRRPSCILVLGGAEDWLSEAARSLFPESRILSVQYDGAYRGRERVGADRRWYPDEGRALASFLLEGVSGYTDGGVSVVPWKPSANAFPSISERVLETVRLVLEEVASDSATSRYWSSRWARNALRNFVEAETFLSVPRSPAPIVIAAAGPSLEEVLKTLGRHRDKVRIWALTSASAACLDAGFRPELLISTDAGFWSDRHFDAIARDRASSETPLAVLLTARIPSRMLKRNPFILLSQNHPFESDLISAAGIPFHPATPRGTAAGDAVSLARASTSGSVFLAGFDMASLDLRSHCRPYGFDPLIGAHAHRLRPQLSRLWERETSAFPVRFGRWRRSRSFDLYASGVASSFGSRVYRLLPSPVPLPGAETADVCSLCSSLASSSRTLAFEPREASVPRRADRARLALEVLGFWEKETLLALRGPGTARLSARSRYLLYALGGAEAADYLAQSARGCRDENAAVRAEEAALSALRLLRETIE